MVITETWLSVHVRSQRELSRQLSLALSPPPSSDFLKPINRLSLCQHVELALPLMRKIVKQTNVRIVFWWNKKSYTQWGNPTERKKLSISVLTVVRKKHKFFHLTIATQLLYTEKEVDSLSPTAAQPHSLFPFLFGLSECTHFTRCETFVSSGKKPLVTSRNRHWHTGCATQY